MSESAFIPLSVVNNSLKQQVPPPSHNFQVFIKPQCSCDQYLKDDLCENTAFIPDLNSEPPVVFLRHLTEYNIGIINRSNYQANAEIYVDGLYIGSFRIHKNSSYFQLERPPHSDRSFTFVSKNSDEALLSGLCENEKLGYITVKIRPEHKDDRILTIPTATDYSTANSDSANSTPSRINIETDGNSSNPNVGGTLLGAKSNQRFQPAPKLSTRGLYIFSFRLMIGEPYNNQMLFIKNCCNYNNCCIYKPCIYNKISK